MGTYNGAKYLDEQLRSFATQIRLPDELIVCDDMSDDRSVEILLDFARAAPFKVEIIRNEKNIGYGRNFEKAISLCKGDVIFLSDQDDVWLPEKIKVVEMEFLKYQSALVVVHDAELVDESLRRTNLTVAGQIRAVGGSSDGLLLGCCIAFRSVMRPLILPLPSDIYGHDRWINNLGNALECRKFIQDVLQLYRRHSANTSESIATRIARVSRWDLFKEQLKSKSFRSDPAAACESRIDQLEILKRRIVDNRVYLIEGCGLITPFTRAISNIDKVVGANRARLYLQNKGLLRRLIGATVFYFRGGYREFEGWKSFAKDLLR